MKKSKFISVIIIAIVSLNLYQVKAQQMPMPLDTTSNYCFFPIHTSCMGKIISYEHLQLSQNFTMNVVCYFLDTTIVHNINQNTSLSIKNNYSHEKA